MERREVEEQQIEFELRQIVWAKITGYPWWPARVTQKPSAKTTAYRVDFFNDHTHAFLNNNKIVKYDQMRSHIDLHRQTNKGLRKAILSADKLFYHGKSYTAHPEVAIGSVEESFPKQKQLLKSPHVKTTLLQENIKSSVAQLSEHPSSESESQSEEQQPFLTHLKYSHEQRQKYVNSLLKKYRLITIPKLPEIITTRKTSTNLLKVNRKRIGRRNLEPKNKHINKIPLQDTNFHYLLTRKIYSILKKKMHNSQQRKQISLSLTRETLNSQGGLQDVNGLFKWLSISPESTIANYYQNWGCMQQEKDKNSNMTTQQ